MEFTDYRENNCFRKGFMEYIVFGVYLWKINMISMSREGRGRYPTEETSIDKVCK